MVKGGSEMNVSIILNGKKADVDEGMSVLALLSSRNIKPEVVTVELNEEILDKPKYNETILRERDKIEFVYYMGGGSTHDPVETRKGRSLTIISEANHPERGRMK